MVSPKSASSPIPLCLACQYGLLSTATLLLEKGAAWQANSDGLFPLHLAAREGHAAIAQLLINSSSGSITSSSSSSASLATSTSSSLMNADIVECKDVFNGWTPLFFAASEGRLDVVKVLLSAGARVNVLDEHGWLPWTYALYKGYIQVAELLVVKDVDFSSNGGDNSLHSSSAPPLVSSPSLPCGGSPATLARQQATLNGGQLFGEGEAQSPMKLGASVLPISSPTSSRSASLKPMAPSSFFHQTGSHVAATVDKAVLDTLDSIDDIPTLSLPPPIIPFRI